MYSAFKALALLFLFCSADHVYGMNAMSRAIFSARRDKVVEAGATMHKRMANCVVENPSYIALREMKDQKVARLLDLAERYVSLKCSWQASLETFREKGATLLTKCAHYPKAAGSLLFLSGMVAGQNRTNPYVLEIEGIFKDAVENDNVDLVCTLANLQIRQEKIAEIALQHALIGAEQKAQNVIEKTKKERGLRADEMHTIANRVREANLQTFTALVEKLNTVSDELIESVVKSGDSSKLDLLLQKGASAEKILKTGIAHKDVDLVVKMLCTIRSDISPKEAKLKAEFLCDRSLFQKVFGDRLFFNFRRTSDDSKKI